MLYSNLTCNLRPLTECTYNYDYVCLPGSPRSWGRKDARPPCVGSPPSHQTTGKKIRIRICHAAVFIDPYFRLSVCLSFMAHGQIFCYTKPYQIATTVTWQTTTTRNTFFAHKILQNTNIFFKLKGLLLCLLSFVCLFTCFLTFL